MRGRCLREDQSERDKAFSEGNTSVYINAKKQFHTIQREDLSNEKEIT